MVVWMPTLTHLFHLNVFIVFGMYDDNITDKTVKNFAFWIYTLSLIVVFFPCTLLHHETISSSLHSRTFCLSKFESNLLGDRALRYGLTLD